MVTRPFQHPPHAGFSATRCREPCSAVTTTVAHDQVLISTAAAQSSRQTAYCRYGAYEICNDPYMSANRLSLIDRGFVFALAHVRGGGEMGRSWYEDGKYLNKKNTFTDFIACAEYLVKEKWTSPAHLCIEVNPYSASFWCTWELPASTHHTCLTLPSDMTAKRWHAF